MTMIGRWFSRAWSWLTGPDLMEDVEAVRKLTVLSCGFLPTVTTVANIIAAGNPAVIGVTAIAIAICQAVTARRVGLVSTTPTVNGIVIEGEFVR